MAIEADAKRYDVMQYQYCGKSGLRLPRISLGLWHNFGDNDAFDEARAMLCRAFDLGVTHFDIANNYGPPPGSAESCFGRVLKEDLAQYRDEMFISTKAGYDMWPGPYGDGGSRKYLISSLDQSLTRTGLDYVDLFYHHCPDNETPLEESMAALSDIHRSGKALYVGISNYSPEKTKEAVALLRAAGTPCLIHQHSYSMLNRAPENGLLQAIEETGIGAIAFCPLAQGLLTDKYLSGIPRGSRANKWPVSLKRDRVTDEIIRKMQRLNDLAQERGQSLAQMALAWVLRQSVMTSALIGASKVSQVENSVAAIKNLEFSDEELLKIDIILT